MKNINFRVLLSAICMASILAGFTKINAGPVRFDQVVQIINAKPGKAETGFVFAYPRCGRLWLHICRG